MVYDCLDDWTDWLFMKCFQAFLLCALLKGLGIGVRMNIMGRIIVCHTYRKSARESNLVPLM